MLTGAIIALALVLWIGFGTQVTIIRRQLIHPRKPVGLDCDCEFIMPEIPPMLVNLELLCKNIEVRYNMYRI
jgi:hypothetical protein